ncbi:phosphonate metabolism transcriptional regulator PhnF [Pseudothauera nasutitermitis]|uniref:Phosphonate metabolism transcriptional regulator PhnF n=1 Tax=Pseudothauera nasutitermitis TaxID=2565930 RepID=A0A4S4AVB8_9RHOO|nr:phosphonate metabolism transcriptional regulator PhnF [Pseudothauera nasutitermitis]THF63951.1 phosphonate metabolism transcriptional regulator PhnF [Pseudothauera nasutitermitis]
MERTNGIALWRQIERTLAEEIHGPAYRPGDRLPTEAELAARFGVNRHTLRRALSALQEAGLVSIEQGRGTFVHADVMEYQIGKRTRFSENVLHSRRQPGGRLLRAQEVPAGAETARALGLRPGTPVLLLEMLREADGLPVSLAIHYFPKERCAGLIEAYEHSGSITSALFSLGIKDYTRAQTRVTTRLPLGDEARLLRQARSQPVLVSEGVNLDPDGLPLEYSVACFAGQRVQFVFDT